MESSRRLAPSVSQRCVERCSKLEDGRWLLSTATRRVNVWLRVHWLLHTHMAASSWPTTVIQNSTVSGAALGKTSQARPAAWLVTYDKTARSLTCVASEPAAHAGALTALPSTKSLRSRVPCSCSGPEPNTASHVAWPTNCAKAHCKRPTCRRSPF